MKKKKILFIINPISGKSRNKNIVNKIQLLIAANQIDAKIKITDYAGHGEEIAHLAINEGIKHFVVVGGDGSINEIARSLYLHKEASLGIIPRGSGNGLAKHLSIPNNLEKAFQIATGVETIAIDVGLLNKNPFFSIAGIGFDAKIADDFSKMQGRGLKNYVIAVIKRYPNYRPKKYVISLNQKTYTVKAFLISLANSNQFGGNAIIAPNADLSDGLIEICMMKKVPILKAIIIFPLIFVKRFHRTKYLDIIQSDSAEILREKPGLVHIDGDPICIKEKLLILELKKKSLNIHIKSSKKHDK